MTTTQHHAGHLGIRFRGNWANQPPPSIPQQWVQRAREVAQILAVDAAAREKNGKTPYAEVALLKDSGLVCLVAMRLGPPSADVGNGWTRSWNRSLATGTACSSTCGRRP